MLPIGHFVQQIYYYYSKLIGLYSTIMGFYDVELTYTLINKILPKIKTIKAIHKIL